MIIKAMCIIYLFFNELIYIYFNVTLILFPVTGMSWVIARYLQTCSLDLYF